MEKGSRILLMGLLSLGIYLTILYLQFQTPYVVIFSGLDGARAACIGSHYSTVLLF